MSSKSRGKKRSNPYSIASIAKKRKGDDGSAIVDQSGDGKEQDKENQDPNSKWDSGTWSEEEMYELIRAAYEAQWFSGGDIRQYSLGKVDNIRNNMSTNRKSKSITDKLTWMNKQFEKVRAELKAPRNLRDSVRELNQEALNNLDDVKKYTDRFMKGGFYKTRKSKWFIHYADNVSGDIQWSGMAVQSS